MKQSKSVCFNIKATWHVISRMYNSYGEKADLGTSTGYVLLNLYSDKGIPSTHIAPELGMEPRSLTRILKSMQEEGLIRREQDKNDKRQVLIYLTEKGIEKKEIARRTVRKFNDIVRKEIPADALADFLNTLNKIIFIAENNQLK